MQTASEPLKVARVNQAWLTEMPSDLYIPPQALQVLLETFEGPLDLLLYLIRKQNIDILDIPMAKITRQYMEYVEIMKAFDLELAADYLVMAALLAQIKSRMLLPRPPELQAEEEDPRMALVRRLQEYERFRRAAEELDEAPRLYRDTWPAQVHHTEVLVRRLPPEMAFQDLIDALCAVLQRAEMQTAHWIAREPLSVRERMTMILDRLAEQGDRDITFEDLCDNTEGRLGRVVTFLAILELLKGWMIDVVQTQTWGPIHVKAAVCSEMTTPSLAS